MNKFDTKCKELFENLVIPFEDYSNIIKESKRK